MGVTDEIRRAEQETAIGALDAPSSRRRVQLRPTNALAFAKTLVVDAERGSILHLLLLVPAAAAVAAHQRTKEALSVRLSDEAATGCRERQDGRCRLETGQLLGSAEGAVDLELIAHGVNLHNVELAQDRVEDLGQTEARFTADSKAGNRLTLQQRLAPFRVVRTAIRCTQNRERMRRQRRQR